jgi:hypothetical protein
MDRQRLRNTSHVNKNRRRGAYYVNVDDPYFSSHSHAIYDSSPSDKKV